MIGKVQVRVVPNDEIYWAGGYPCGESDSGIVHAVTGGQMHSYFLCGARMSGTWTKKKLSCKRCKKAIKNS